MDDVRDRREAEQAALEHMTQAVSESGGDPERPRTRRQLIKLAGAAVAGGAALTVAGARPAAAANGDPVLLGEGNTATLPTTIESSGGGLAAVVAVNTADGGWGLTAAGTGNAQDIKLNGTGRLSQAPALSGLAQPTWNIDDLDIGAGVEPAHEIARSTGGIIWASTGSGAAANTRWKRINAVRVDNPSGNGSAFAPFRLLDTRNGTGGVTGKRAVNTNTTINAAGHANLPDDTVAIFGNVTVTGPTSAGYLKLFPSGVSEPLTSAINFTAGQTIANFFFLGLGTSGGSAGRFVVRPGGLGETHVIIDVTGYVQ